MRKSCFIALIAFFTLTLVFPAAQADKPSAGAPPLSKETRLMVFSPHPDDESLGAGGIIQRVLGLGGRVRVVFMTNGDGFPEGVETADNISRPTAVDYREYGDERRKEALAATAVLGVKEHDVTFLGFPDGGLCALLKEFRSGARVYTSPFTQASRPPVDEIILPKTAYDGRDLRAEIARVLVDFRPDLVMLPAREDQHSDHSSTYYFVREALKVVNGKEPALKPAIFAYLVHFGQWPIGQGAGSGSRLNPPLGFSSPKAHWVSFPLEPKEANCKQKAILSYHTQMLVMGRFLMSFARGNELFIAYPAGSEK